MTTVIIESTGFHESVEAGTSWERYRDIHLQRLAWINAERSSRHAGVRYQDTEWKLESEARNKFIIPPISEVSCPLCGSAVLSSWMYDREDDPDYKCRSQKCLAGIIVARPAPLQK